MFLFLFLHAVKGKSAFNTGHARQFRFPFTFIQTDALRKCLAVLDLLRHPEVAERPGGKLWPMRDQKHLAALGKSFEPFRNPPTPASTSSKMSVASSSCSCTETTASMNRDSSPPEAILSRGCDCCPGLGDHKSLTRSSTHPGNNATSDQSALTRTYWEKPNPCNSLSSFRVKDSPAFRRSGFRRANTPASCS